MPTTKERPSTKAHKPAAKRTTTKQSTTAAQVEIQTRAPEWALAVHARASVMDIPAVMSQALPEAWLAAEHIGLRPVLPFARYFSFEAGGAEFEPAQIEFEAGVLVDGVVAYGEGRVQPVQLPGGEVAVATHVGPYELLSQTYDLMQHWIADHARTSVGPMWEVYLDDPDTVPVTELRTEVVIPLD
jgi:GyrI-like small molecule binding domain